MERIKLTNLLLQEMINFNVLLSEDFL